MCWTHQSTLSL